MGNYSKAFFFGCCLGLSACASEPAVATPPQAATEAPPTEAPKFILDGEAANDYAARLQTEMKGLEAAFAKDQKFLKSLTDQAPKPPKGDTK